MAKRKRVRRFVMVDSDGLLLGALGSPANEFLVDRKSWADEIEDYPIICELVPVTLAEVKREAKKGIGT